MQWLSDRGPVPQHVGALLLFDHPCALSAEDVRAGVRDRLAAVPALRRRPVRPPRGCGGWLWLDDPGDPDEQVHVERVDPGHERVEQVAAALVMRRLPAARPPWAAYVLADGGGRPVGVVACVHHVLTDGVLGMALLAALLDGARQRERHDEHPGPRPSATSAGALPPRRVLLADAWSRRWAALRRLPSVSGELRAAWAEMGRGTTPKALPSSLNRPTGRRRDVAVIDVDLATVRSAAHAAGASVNDALLVAVGATLGALQEGRGEHLDPVVASVPVAARQEASGRGGAELGNAVGAVPFAIPTAGPVSQRLAAVTHARTERLSGRHGASMPLVLAAFRVLAAVHLVQRYATHQHLVNTLVTNVRGPDEAVALFGTRVGRIVPFVVNQGNVTVAFAAASYAGRMTVAVTTDPEAGLAADLVADRLGVELAELSPLT